MSSGWLNVGGALTRNKIFYDIWKVVRRENKAGNIKKKWKKIKYEEN